MQRLHNSRKLRDQTQKIFFVQILSGLLTFAFFTLVARTIGSESVGLLFVGLTISGIFLDFVDFGACAYLARELAANKIDSNFYWRVASRKIGFVGVAGFSIAILLSRFLDLKSEIFFFGAYSASWLLMNYTSQFFFAKQIFKLGLSLILFEKAVCIFFFFLFLPIENGIFLGIVPLIIGLLAHSILGISYIYKILEKKKLRFSFHKKENLMVARKSRFFGYTSILTDIVNLDLMIVASTLSLSDAGTYSIGQKFRNPLTLGSQSFATRAKPVIAGGNLEEIREVYLSSKRYFIANTIMIGIVAVNFLFFGDFIFGSSFQNINEVLFIGALASLPASVSLICSSHLVASGFDKLNSIVVSIFVPLFLLCVFLVSSHSGLINTAWTILYLNIFMASIFVVYTARIWRDAANAR